MNSLQAMMDGFGAHAQTERAKTQMTLGGLIEALEKMPEDAPVANLISPQSYRGYYCDLAFEREKGMRRAIELLRDCRGSMGQVYCGYKGGDYLMGASTPVWVADYGNSGDKLMAVNPDGTIETAEDE